MTPNPTQGLVLRFAGPFEENRGQLTDIELNGESVNIGEWHLDDQGCWLLVLNPVYQAAPELLSALEDLVAEVYVPERDCCCHISPPCNDCVNNGAIRESHEHAKAVIKEAHGVTK